MGGRACGLPIHWTLQLRATLQLQEHLRKIWWEQGQARGERRLLGGEDDGVVEWATLPKRSEALKEREHRKLSRFNEPRWTLQRMTFRRDVSLMHVA
jgi:hypothetical protein